jgi:hypothetical protein
MGYEEGDDTWKEEDTVPTHFIRRYWRKKGWQLPKEKYPALALRPLKFDPPFRPLLPLPESGYLKFVRVDSVPTRTRTLQPGGFSRLAVPRSGIVLVSRATSILSRRTVASITAGFCAVYAQRTLKYSASLGVRENKYAVHYPGG